MTMPDKQEANAPTQSDDLDPAYAEEPLQCTKCGKLTPSLEDVAKHQCQANKFIDYTDEQKLFRMLEAYIAPEDYEGVCIAIKEHYKANYTPKAQAVQGDDWIDAVFDRYPQSLKPFKDNSPTAYGMVRAAIQAHIDAAYQRGFDNASRAAFQSLSGYYTQAQVDEAVKRGEIKAHKWWFNQAAHVADVFKEPMDKKQVTLESIQFAARHNLKELGVELTTQSKQGVE